VMTTGRVLGRRRGSWASSLFLLRCLPELRMVARSRGLVSLRRRVPGCAGRNCISGRFLWRGGARARDAGLAGERDPVSAPLDRSGVPVRMRFMRP